MAYRIRKNFLLTMVSVAVLAAGCSDDDDDDPVANGENGANGTNGANGSGTQPFVQPAVYAGFPVTLKDAEGESSVSYAGQMARHVLRESVKAAVKSPDTSGYEVIGELNGYIKNENNVIDDAPIKAPVTKGDFIIKEMVNNELGTGRNLSGKMFDPAKSGDPISGVAEADAGKTLGAPNGITAAELVELWVNHVGADQAGSLDGEPDNYDLVNGYDYSQLLPKFLMGSVFYYQTVNHYLDENLVEPGTRDNDQPYSEGAIYTGKEHSWDEGFGYFGAAAHYGDLSAEENYEINKMGKSISGAEALALADKDGDGKVSLYTEYNSGPAYYAASFDRDGKSTYGPDIMDAFLKGRTMITNAVDEEGHARKLTDQERSDLTALAAVIQRNWETVIAEAVFKYAGVSFEQIEALEAGTTTDPKEYYKVWGELKGFMLSLQYGGPNSIIDKANFEDIDNLIGLGPVMMNGQQVNGIAAGENATTFTLSEGNSVADYKAALVEVQKKVDALYSLKAKQYDHTDFTP